jgi:hypothetical protein
MEIINTDFNDRFKHGVYADHRRVKQIDLFKINHFDNPAKATSLKTLEFNMRMNSVEDLPFKVGTMLDQAQAEVLRKYCQHDVIATKMFYRKNQSKIAFRESLERQYPGRDWLNFDDTKIGKEYFTIKLTDAGVQLYDYAKSGRTPRQTRRPYIDLNQCIFPWLAFDEPEFQRVLTWMRGQSINETKGVFTDVTATVGGLEYVFGLGGIHASVENTTIRATDDMLIESWDVSSMYPNIAISHGLYPAHLGASFNAVYRGLYAERQKYPKKSDPSEMIKLALNSSYGNSNNQFSFFYDPQFTMSITTNGQLMLCKLAVYPPSGSSCATLTVLSTPSTPRTVSRLHPCAMSGRSYAS